MSMRWGRGWSSGLRLLRWTIAWSLEAIGVLTLVVLLTPFPSWLARPLASDPEARRADVVVVLAGPKTPTDHLTDDALRRVVHGVRALNRGLAKRMIVSGGAFQESKDEYRRVVRELGVSEDVLIRESRSRRTLENAVETRKILESIGASSVLLVTSPTHMYRAKRVFEKQGIGVMPAPTEGDEMLPASASERVALVERALYEYGAIALYWWRGWI